MLRHSTCALVFLLPRLALAQINGIQLASLSSAGEQANNHAFGSTSGNGKFVVFTSQATNLISNDTNGSGWDAFVRDLQQSETTVASVNSMAQQGSAMFARISADGRFVAFDSSAPNLIKGIPNGWHQVFMHDRLTGVTEQISVTTSGEQADGGQRSFSLVPMRM